MLFEILKSKYVPIRGSTPKINYCPFSADSGRKKKEKPNSMKGERGKHMDNITTLFNHTNATPLRCQKDIGYGCCFCEKFCEKPGELKEHTRQTHQSDIHKIMRKKSLNQYHVKLDITGLQCNLCNTKIDNLDAMMHHLQEHKKDIHLDVNNHIMPFSFEGDELHCVICKAEFNKFKKLTEHMNKHYRNRVCDICGAGFINHKLFQIHSQIHKKGVFTCEFCKKVFDTSMKKRSHELSVHVHSQMISKCGYCNKKFKSRWSKEKHIASEHGVPLKEMKCKLCGKVFMTSNALRIHRRRDHLKERPYKCELCDFTSYESRCLRNHMLKHTGVRDFQCDICLKSYAKKKTLREHLRIHANDRRFKCQYCELAFIQKYSGHKKKEKPSAMKGEREKHMDNITTLFYHTNATPLRCQKDIGYGCCFCEKFCEKPGELKEHTRQTHQSDIHKIMRKKSLNHYHVKLDITGLQCNECNTEIDNLDAMMHHLQEHKKDIHLDINNHIMPFSFEGDELRCVMCKAEFNKFKKLTEHMNKHYRNRVCDVCGAGFINHKSFQIHSQVHKKGVFTCEFCKKVFDTSMKKRSHELSVHVHSQMVSKCGYCNKKFKSRRSKEKHIASEHGVPLKEIKCKLCGKVFLTANALRVHTRRDHLKERPYECQLCDFTSYGSSCLRNHMLKHTGVRDFQCDICLKSYAKKKTLREHLRIHANDRRFKCQYCELAFIQKCSLKGHMQSKHRDLVLVPSV
nr:zinc finger protein 26-like [Maniola hyperantus]